MGGNFQTAHSHFAIAHCCVHVAQCQEPARYLNWQIESTSRRYFLRIHVATVIKWRPGRNRVALRSCSDYAYHGVDLKTVAVVEFHIAINDWDLSGTLFNGAR